MLAGPPWTKASASTATPVVLADLAPPGPGAPAWADGEREKWIAPAPLLGALDPVIVSEVLVGLAALAGAPGSMGGA